MRTIDEVGMGYEDDAAPAEPQPESSPDSSPRMARGVWVAALALLGVVTLVAIVALGRAVVPPAAGAVGDGVGWAAGTVGEGAQAAGDTWSGWTNQFQEIAERPVPVEAQAPVAVTAGGSQSLLLTVASDNGGGVAFALLARAPDGTATLVLAPPGLLGILPGYGDFRLSESLRFEGPELASLTLTNSLGIRIDSVVALEPGDLSAALSTAITVDLPVPLIVSEGDSGRVLAKSGRADRSPAVAETILVTRGSGDELEWLQRQAAVWEAVLAEIDADPGLAGRLVGRSASAAASTELLVAAAGGDVAVTAVPVSRVAVGGPDAGYTLAGEAAATFVVQRLGHLVLREDRPRVEVLNGNGLVGTTRVVAHELVRRGYRIIKTDNADAFDYGETQVVAQGRDNRAVGDEVLRILGSGELLLEIRAPSAVVDISIIIGADIPAGEG